jgi:periplasmic protein TonB
VTLSETFDWPEIPISETAAWDTDDFVAPAIAIDDSEAHDKDRPEPIFVETPFFVDFDEPLRLDPGRAGLIWELPPMVRRAIELRSPLASLLFHLLPLLGIIIWPLMMIEPPPPIPVQLVFEQPPPPPPPPPPQPKPAPKAPKFEVPPRGPLSSVDQGAVKPADLGRAPDPVQNPAAATQRQKPSETQTAAAEQAPPIPQPKPTPPKEHQSAFQLPKPSGAQTPHHEETPHEAQHSARFAGPAATRNEYLAYLVSLTRQHIGLLPLSYVGDRHGETVLTIVIHDNGAIGPITVARSSGYPDIDERVERMVAAIGRAPPLPQWFQGDAMELAFTIRFPEALERQE